MGAHLSRVARKFWAFWSLPTCTSLPVVSGHTARATLHGGRGALMTEDVSSSPWDLWQSLRFAAPVQFRKPLRQGRIWNSTPYSAPRHDKTSAEQQRVKSWAVLRIGHRGLHTNPKSNQNGRGRVGSRVGIGIVRTLLAPDRYKLLAGMQVASCCIWAGMEALKCGATPLLAS